MDFGIQQTISNFVSSQFPKFYEKEGPNLILFMKAYYEWMESTGNPIGEARNLYNYRDIDNTLEAFLSHFQQKYLYGIPSQVISNKRFLIKNILDVYQSKGNIECYKLLFKLVYNQDVEVYIPGYDILRASDGTWTQPRYIEITDNGNLASYIGQSIYGVSSGTTAIVQDYTKQSINGNIINTFYIANITPPSSQFAINEPIVLTGANISEVITEAPLVIGSLSTLSILNGGQNFAVGNILAIDNVNNNNAIISHGVGGKLRVTGITSSSNGQLSFSIAHAGFGVTTNALCYVFNGAGDTTGTRGSFSVGSITFPQNITYNTDIIANYTNTVINATSYSFPANTSANLSSNIGIAMSYANQTFGSLSSLTNISTGLNYTQQACTFVRNVMLSNTQYISGTVSYNTANSVITGTNTAFSSYFANNDLLALVANNTSNASLEIHVIKTVTNATSLTLYDKPTHNSSATAYYLLAPVILVSDFASGNSIMYTDDGTTNGLNSIVAAYPSTGNNIIANVVVVDSGYGYVQNENVIAYLYGSLNTPSVIMGGKNYINNQPLVFSGGGTSSIAVGYITTNSSGSVVNTTLTYAGTGYNILPTITVQSNGVGATFNTSIAQYNKTSQVVGTVVTSGQGISPGYWTTTRSFLNSDKYIQDSYFYQDFSYQLRVATALATYKNIIYNSFHPAGTELFGEYLNIDIQQRSHTILYSGT